MVESRDKKKEGRNASLNKDRRLGGKPERRKMGLGT